MTGSASARLFVLGFFLTAVTLSAHATTTPKKKVVYGTAIVFLGWSPDSKYVAYTWTQTRRARKPGKKPRVVQRRLNRRVWKQRLSTYGPASGRDVAAYAKRHNYVVAALPRIARAKSYWTFKAPEGRYVFRLIAGKKLHWELSFKGKKIAGAPCDALYVDVTPTLYPAPDNRTMLIHLHQNTGWGWEDALALAKLPSSVARKVPTKR